MTRTVGQRTEHASVLDGVWERGTGRVCLRVLSRGWSATDSPVTAAVLQRWAVRLWCGLLAFAAVGFVVFQLVGVAGWLFSLPLFLALLMLAGWLCWRAGREVLSFVVEFFGLRRRFRRPLTSTRRLRRSPQQAPRYAVDSRSVARVEVERRLLRSTVVVRTFDGHGATYQVFGPNAPGRLITALSDAVGAERVVRSRSGR